MADLALKFRVGGTAAGTAASVPGFVGDRAAKILAQAAEKKGLDRVIEAIQAHESQIVAEIAADAAKFGVSAAKVFTRIQSPATGAVSISLDDIHRNAGVTSTDSLSKRLQGKTTTQWQALTRATIANKQRRMRRARRGGARGSAGSANTFFVDTGALRDVLNQYLGPALAMLLDPKIVVKRGPRKVTATISVMAQASGREKAGVTGASFPGVSAPGVLSRNESLFVRYLKRAGVRDDPKHPLAYKLENPRGAHRPFLQNTLAFWISVRLPAVLEKSLKSALSRRLKKVK